MKNGTIGIIGGMGPQASAHLLQVFVKLLSESGYSGETYPQILLDSIPVPNFMNDKTASQTAEKILKQDIKLLENFNPMCFALACNTAHILLNKLTTATQVPFISIIHEVIARVESSGLNTVGILASPTTIASQLYQHALFEAEIEYIIPSPKNQSKLVRIIECILDNRDLNKAKEELSSISNCLLKKGAEGIILGCTELPLLFEKTNSYPVFDSIEILAQALLDYYSGKGVSLS